MVSAATPTAEAERKRSFPWLKTRRLVWFLSLNIKSIKDSY